MTSLELWTDAAIGETRQALVRDGRANMLHVSRWSDAGRRAQWGETYVGRIRSVDARLRGAFVDMGLGSRFGFARLDSGGRVRIGGESVVLNEGQAVRVHVSREGVRDKGPVVEIVETLIEPGKLGRVARHRAAEEADAAGPADQEIREKLDALVEAALDARAQVPGGGVLHIEPTAALVAVDVDAAARQGPADPERFAHALNLAAAAEVARQLRLRGHGGIIAVDFVSMRDRRAQADVVAALKSAVADDPWGVTVAPMSRFGVVELSRGQLRAPLADLLCDEDGTPSAETIALAVLRGIERETRIARGRVVKAFVSEPVCDWLESDAVAWRLALEARIGTRWEVCRVVGAARAQWHVEAR